MKWGVAAVCGFEIVAITTGRVPTVTELCRRYPALKPIILAAMAAHLAHAPVAALAPERGA